MDSVNVAEITICYECCRFLIGVLDSPTVDESDKEVAVLMLKEKFEKLGMELNVT